MAQAIQTFSISAPGFYGLNTQDSPLDLSAGFALTATNCIIDQYGRIGARKGWSKVNSSTGNLGSNDVTAIHELIGNDGTSTVLFAGNSKLFKLDGSNAVVELTYGGGGTTPTISASNWKIATLNGKAYFFQSGHAPLVYDPATSTTTYKRVTEMSGYTGTVPQADIVISAYGRLWAANTTTDKYTVYFSDLLNGAVWSTGTAGSLDISRVWPSGSDEISGIAAHNGFLIIFGKSQILVYQGATSPATISLSDTVSGIGCIARDSIQNTGTDVIFLSNSGVRSFLRTIQEKSAPLRDLSKNVRNNLMEVINGETKSSIKSVYSEFQAFYLLSCPTAKVVYCFDTRGTLQDGASRTTTWDSIEPKSFCNKVDGTLLIGKTGYIGEYDSYYDDTATYRMVYFTNHADIGNVNQTSILKRLTAIIIGGSDQSVTFKWGFDFNENYRSQSVQIPLQGTSYYNIGEYGIAEYSDGIALQTLTVNATGYGKIVQTGYESDINGAPLSIQKIEIQAKNGKLT